MSIDIRPAATACTPGSHEWFHHFDDAGARYEACSVCDKRARWIPVWGVR